MTDPIPLHPTGRHPVDRLAEVRELLKALKREEKELQAMVVAGDCSKIGEDWTASVQPGGHDYVPLARAKDQLPPLLFRSVVEHVHYDRVMLTRIRSNRAIHSRPQEAPDGA